MRSLLVKDTKMWWEIMVYFLFCKHLSMFCKLAELFLGHHQETIPHFRQFSIVRVCSKEGAGGVPDGGGRPVELVPLVRHGQLRSHQAGHPTGFT